MNSNPTQPSKGFLAVASRRKNFYYSAINLLEGIKDYYPEAQTCLVCDEWMHDREPDIDHIIFTEKQDDYRAKMWGMWKSPFDITLYMDADMECVHEDISTVFDMMGDHDLMFQELTKERDPVFKNRHFPKGSFQYNGGVCMFNSGKPHVRDFMHRWWELFTEQYNDRWWPAGPDGGWDDVGYGKRTEMKHWDQFTLWYLLNEESKWSDIDVGVFEDDLRWNYFTHFKRFGLIPNKEPVILHYSGGFKKDQDVFAYGS